MVHEIQIGEDNRLPWQTELDAKKYLTDVHMPFKDILGTDFKQAKFSDQDREFIMTMVGAGIMIKEICPNPDIGNNIKELDFSYIYTLAVLKFNLDGNMIVDRITNWEKQQSEETGESSWIEQMKKQFGGEKKKKEE